MNTFSFVEHLSLYAGTFFSYIQSIYGSFGKFQLPWIPLEKVKTSFHADSSQISADLYYQGGWSASFSAQSSGLSKKES